MVGFSCLPWEQRDKKRDCPSLSPSLSSPRQGNHKFTGDPYAPGHRPPSLCLLSQEEIPASSGWQTCCRGSPRLPFLLLICCRGCASPGHSHGLADEASLPRRLTPRLTQLRLSQREVRGHRPLQLCPCPPAGLQPPQCPRRAPARAAPAITETSPHRGGQHKPAWL